MSVLYANPPAPAIRRPHAEGEWELCETVRVVDGSREFVIPAGFTSDLASIPRIARPLMETADLGIVPAVAHDWLYRNGGLGLYTRLEADRLMLGLMEWCGVSWLRRKLAYRAVRWFGWTAWRG